MGGAQRLCYLELELSGETALLAEALQAESAEAAPSKKHWYWTRFDSFAEIIRSL